MTEHTGSSDSALQSHTATTWGGEGRGRGEGEGRGEGRGGGRRQCIALSSASSSGALLPATDLRHSDTEGGHVASIVRHGHCNTAAAEALKVRAHGNTAQESKMKITHIQSQSVPILQRACGQDWSGN